MPKNRRMLAAYRRPTLIFVPCGTVLALDGSATLSLARVRGRVFSVTKVIVTGALGRMGRETIAALAQDSTLDLAGGVAPHASEEYLDLPGGGGLIPIARDLET